MSKKYIILLIILLSLGLIYFKYYNNQEVQQVENYDSIIVQKGELVDTILSTGDVYPQNRLELSPPIVGRVESVLANEGDIVKKGQILGWMSSTERAALLDAARSKDESEVAKWEELYRMTPIMAPLSGIVISRILEPGQSVSPSTPILVISDKLIIRALVDETDIAKIFINQRAIIRTDAYPEKAINAKVIQVAYEAKIVQNVTMYEIDIRPEVIPSYLRSGMTANIEFVMVDFKDVLLVPALAVENIQENNASVVINKSGKKKNITIGANNGRFYQVLEGLKENDKIYTKRLPNLMNQSEEKESPFSFRRKRSGKNKK